MTSRKRGRKKTSGRYRYKTIWKVGTHIWLMWGQLSVSQPRSGNKNRNRNGNGNRSLNLNQPGPTSVPFCYSDNRRKTFGRSRQQRAGQEVGAKAEVEGPVPHLSYRNRQIAVAITRNESPRRRESVDAGTKGWQSARDIRNAYTYKQSA